MSCNVSLSRCSSFKCCLNCWMVLLIACKQFDWCCRDEGKGAEEPGVNWWTAGSVLDWFVDLRRGRRRVPSVMCWLIEGEWDGIIYESVLQNSWTRGRLIALELYSEIGGSEEDWYWGRKDGARGFSDISGEVQLLPEAVLPIVEKEKMCFGS